MSNTLHPDTRPLPFPPNAISIDLAPLLRDFDRRGCLAELAEETWSVIKSFEGEYISVFANHFAQADGMRGRWTADQIHAAMFNDNDYTRKKLSRPTNGDWVEIACHHAWGVRAGGVPLSSPLSALAAAYAFLNDKLRETIGHDPSRYRRLSPVLPNLAMLECGVLAAATEAIRERQLFLRRDERIEVFQRRIVTEVDELAKSSVRVVGIVNGIQAASSDLHVETSRLARASQRSAKRIRAAATKAAALGSAIERSRETIVTGWALALAAEQRSKAALEASERTNQQAKQISAGLEALGGIGTQLNEIGRDASNEAWLHLQIVRRIGDAGQEGGLLVSEVDDALGAIETALAKMLSAGLANVEAIASINRTVADVRRSNDRLLGDASRQSEAAVSMLASITEAAGAGAGLTDLRTVAALTGDLHANIAGLIATLDRLTDGARSIGTACTELVSQIVSPD